MTMNQTEKMERLFNDYDRKYLGNVYQKNIREMYTHIENMVKLYNEISNQDIVNSEQLSDEQITDELITDITRENIDNYIKYSGGRDGCNYYIKLQNKNIIEYNDLYSDNMTLINLIKIHG